MTADAVNTFWFGTSQDAAAVLQGNMKRWFGGGPALDAEIGEKFGAFLDPAAVMDVASWANTPTGRLAAIVVFDQFTRNVFRGTPRAFGLDPWARGLAREGIERRIDQKLGLAQRMFFYLPFEHSEDPADQVLSVELYKALAEEAPKGLQPMLAGIVDYALAHKKIIDQWGRFPHRNAILGRESTPEELAFLQTPGSSF